MQKKNLAALVASLFIIPVAAHADVTIYGFISGGIESAKATGNNTAVNYSSRTRVVDDNSRIGFKGWEDLGNGTKAIWQVESSLRNFEQGGTNDAGQAASLGTRNTFVGLDNQDVGKLLIGNYDSAYKTLSGSGNSDLGLDLMINTTADNFGAAGNNIAVFNRAESRLKNSISYYSPSWAGFKLGGSWGVDEKRATDLNGNGTDAKHLSLGLAYNWNSLNLSTGWDKTYDTSINPTSTLIYNSPTAVSGSSISFFNLLASYKFDFGTYIGGGYEWGTYNVPGGSQLKQNDWTVAVAQDIGAASIKLSYSQLGSLSGLSAGNNGDDYKAKQWMLGGTYNLSKSTQLFGYYTKITNNAKQYANFANNPVYSSGSTTTAGATYATLNAGLSPQAVGVGMKVSF